MMRWFFSFIVLFIFSNSWAVQQQIPISVGTHIIHADFNQATGLALDNMRQLYVLDGMNSRIIVFSPEGKKLREIKSKNIQQDFYKAMGLSILNDKLYVADSLKHRIIEYSLQGEWLRNIILTAPEKQTLLPEPVALLVREHEIIYADRRWHRICYLDIKTGTKKHCIGERGEMKAQFQYPFQIAVDRDGYLNVVDILNARIQVFDRAGQYYSQTGKFSTHNFYRPNANTFDFLDFQYISDVYLGTISIFQKGRFLGLLANKDGETLKFTTPVAIQYDSAGYLYILDAKEQQVTRVVLDYKALIAFPKKEQEISRKNCVLCHLSWADGSRDIALRDEQAILPVAAFDMCYSCHHGAVLDSRQAIPHDYQHPTVYDLDEEKNARHKALPRKDKIPELYPHTDKQELSCTACHTPHNNNQEPPTLYSENHNAWLRGTDYGSEQCEACHEKNTKGAGRELEKIYGLNHPLGTKMHKPKGKKIQHLETEDPHLQKGLPKGLLANGAVLGKDDALVCQSCHQIHQGKTENLLTETDKSGVLCASCHKRQAPKDAKAARKAGVHPVDVELEEPVEIRGKKVASVQCQSCHSVHKGTLETALYPDKIQDAEELCIGCHQRQHAKDDKEAMKKGIHPMNLELDESVKIAGKMVKKIGCLSCHSIHDGEPNTPVLLEQHQNGELCENCHEGKQRLVGTDHDLRVTAKDSENQQEEKPLHSGVCGSCHSLHRGEAKQQFLSSVISVDKQERDKTAPGFKRDELCLNCHQKEGIAKDKEIIDYGHPYQDMVLRSDEKLMPLLGLEQEKITPIGGIACITCHEPHTWKPLTVAQAIEKSYPVLDFKKQENSEGNVVDSFLRHKGVKGTFCVDCHALESLPKYKYYHHKNKVRDIGIDYLQ